MVENNSRLESASQILGTEKENGVRNGVDATSEGKRVLDGELFESIRVSVLERKSKNKQSLYQYLQFAREANGRTWEGACFASDLVDQAVAIEWAAKWFLEFGNLDRLTEFKLRILLDLLESVDGVNAGAEECLRMSDEQSLKNYVSNKQRK